MNGLAVRPWAKRNVKQQAAEHVGANGGGQLDYATDTKDYCRSNCMFVDRTRQCLSLTKTGKALATSADYNMTAKSSCADLPRLSTD